MSALSNPLEVKVYDWIFRPGTSVTRHTALWLALYTAVSDADAGTGTEVSGGSYARVDVTSSFGACDSITGIGANSADIVFAAPTADWGVITHVGLRDASTSGTPITRIVPLAAPVTILNGDPAKQFQTGELTAQVA